MNAQKMQKVSLAIAVAATLPILGACSSGKSATGGDSASGKAGDSDGAKIAFLMPDQASTRY